MTIRQSLPSDEDMEPVRDLFAALDSFHHICKPRDAETPPAIAFSRLYAYATGGEGADDPDDPAVSAALQDSPAIRRDLRRLLEKTSRWSLPRVAAASTGDIRQRSGANCRIRFEDSRAEPDQVYVIIEITERDAGAPGALFVCDQSEHCDKFPLPAARDGVIQLLLARNSDMLSKLMDINTEIYLG